MGVSVSAMETTVEDSEAAVSAEDITPAVATDSSIPEPTQTDNICEAESQLNSVCDDTECSTSSKSTKKPKLVHFKLQKFDDENEEEDENTDSMNKGDSNLSRRNRLKRFNSMIPDVGMVDELSSDELKLKASLYYHICNPLKRWKVKRIVPYKMILQIIKTLVVLIQVFFFTFMLPNNRAAFFVKAQGLFEHWFLKSQGKISELYTQQELIEEISYATERYYQLPNLTFGNYGYQLDSNGNPLPVMAVLKQYKQINISPSNNSIVLDGTIQTGYINITDSETDSFDQIQQVGFDWNRFVHLSLLIGLKNVRIVRNEVDCFLFNIKIEYSNSDHSGIVGYSLVVDDEQYIRCNSQTNQNKAASTSFIAVATIVDLAVIVLCSLSMFFAVIKYWRGYKLGKAMGEFYRNKLNLSLTWRERRSLFSTWLLFTFISDVLLIFGSIFKILLDYNADVLSTNVRILLGTGVVVEAGTILRYVSFFKQLNALTRTLTYVLPDLLKFLLCTAILFVSFSICGSIIFSPYNERFSDFSKSLQSLFVLTNGDDIYPMFRSFDSTTNIAVIVYGQIFIYVFVALFVYAVLNLFTSLIISAHDQSQKTNRSTINEVRRFIFSGALTENGGALCDITHVHKYVEPDVILRKDDGKRKDSLLTDID